MMVLFVRFNLSLNWVIFQILILYMSLIDFSFGSKLWLTTSYKMIEQDIPMNVFLRQA